MRTVKHDLDRYRYGPILDRRRRYRHDRRRGRRRRERTPGRGPPAPLHTHSTQTSNSPLPSHPERSPLNLPLRSVSHSSSPSRFWPHFLASNSHGHLWRGHTKTKSQQKPRHDAEGVAAQTRFKENTEAEVPAGSETCVAAWNVYLESHQDE